MFRIVESSVGKSSDKCPFAGQCASYPESCEQISITTEREHYRPAQQAGLHPELTRRGYTYRDFSSDQLVKIYLCPAATGDPAVIEELRRFLPQTDAPADIYIDDAEELRALREVENILYGEADIDEIQTDLGMNVVDRVTGGEYISRLPIRYRLADLSGQVEIVPVYELEAVEPIES